MARAMTRARSRQVGIRPPFPTRIGSKSIWSSLWSRRLFRNPSSPYAPRRRSLRRPSPTLSRESISTIFGRTWLEFRGSGCEAPAGTDVQLRFAEVLNPDGTLYVDNLRTAKATDHFILSGKGEEEFQPDFTFHGFRYIEVTGLKDKPDLTTVKAVAIYTDAPFTVQLHSGSPMINQLWSNILWGQRSNFVGVPTDCPQRDERLGWTADAQVFWRTASYNMGLTQFSKKFAGDIRGTQVGTPMYGIFAPGTDTPNPGFGAGWSDAGVIIPWTAWLQSGDTRVVEQNWDAMEKYLAAIQAANPGYLWRTGYGTPFGDWLSPEGPTLQPLVATAYWAYDVTLMQQMAHALGKTEDEAKYAVLFGNIKSAFANEFIHGDGFIAAAEKGPSPFGQHQQSRSPSCRWRYANRVCAGAEYEAGARLAARCCGRQAHRQNRG